MSMAQHIRRGERLAPFHYALDEPQWRAMIDARPGWFIAHWCDDSRAYALFLDQETPLMASTPLIDGRYFALSASIPAASWPERIAQDLWGSLPLGAADTEPALDRGGWASVWPLSQRSVASDHSPPDPGFREAAHTDMAPFAWGNRQITPGAAHIGLMQQVQGRKPEEALRLIGRSVSAGFVAAPLAYSRAIEQALGLVPSDAVRDARTLLAEIERITVHCRDIALMARLTGFALLATHAALAEDLCAALCAQHGASRRLMDAIAPDGIAAGIDICALAHAVHDALMPRLPVLEGLHDQMAEILEGLGVITASTAERFCLGGLIGRASGRSFDLRQLEDDMRHVPGRAGSRLAGDGWARQCLRLDEIRDALRRIERIATQFGAPLPMPPPVPTGSGEGIGAAEGPHGDLWCWVRLKEARLDSIMLRDPALATLSVLPSLMHDRWEDRLVLASLGFDPGGAEQ
ncbi:hypothetical protein HW511_00980 [Asaia siamensis]|uniref:Hydrogenase expression protein HypE n=1 Tax=Asaia siamensis TaxID=110479 RepID=A0ABQ1MAH7_9PROT|nr:hypothetical protein [Asaia siamensis]GBR06007.1 NADH-ubiquinone oxidoreductase subunit 49kDa [Asaia siamensis NRIC 0323]GGC35378.1 hydrogenase expression protein HypE [Asaia siamensis]